jgi:protein-disulfide isomerase
MTDTPTAIPAPTRRSHTRPKRWLGWLAGGLALVGWWLSIDLLLLSAGAHATNPWLEATCAPASSDAAPSDCLSVLNSRWARFDLFASADPATGQGFPLPLAALGAAYFAFVAIWYLLVGPPTEHRWGWHLLITAVIGLGAVRSAYLTYVMAAVLHRWCFGCLAAHIVNGLLLLITIVAFPWTKRTTELKPHPQRRLALATFIAGLSTALIHVLAAALLLAGTGMRQLKDSYLEIVNDPEFARWRYEQQSVSPIPLRQDESLLGDAGAPNTVVAFIDFQCPACQLAHDALTHLVEQHGDAVRVAFRLFPQDPECNPQFKTGGHPAACRAARACEAALHVGGPTSFNRMRALLYDRRRDLELNRFVEWAVELGLDGTAFSEAMNSAAVADQIQADIELGNHLGITKVPILFLNGRRVEHWRNPQTWEVLLGVQNGEPPPASQP